MYLREKRIHQRKAVRTEGWLGDAAGNWDSIVLLDVSKGGFAFISQQKIEEGSMHPFRIQLPTSSRLMNFVGRIANCMENPVLVGYRVGVQFDKIDIVDLATIEWFVDEKPSGKY